MSGFPDAIQRENRKSVRIARAPIGILRKGSDRKPEKQPNAIT